MSIFNKVGTGDEPKVNVTVHKDKDGYNVIQIQEIYSSVADIPTSDKEVVLQAARSLDKSFTKKQEINQVEA